MGISTMFLEIHVNSARVAKLLVLMDNHAFKKTNATEVSPKSIPLEDMTVVFA